MANYYAYARSNYFRVKDLPDFDAFCRKWDLAKTEREERVGFLVNSEHGLNTGYYYDPETGEDVEANFEQELSSHLLDGEVAIVIQIGWEKLRYLTAWAWAVNHEGKLAACDISEIYERAKELNPKGAITLCEY